MKNSSIRPLIIAFAVALSGCAGGDRDEQPSAPPYVVDLTVIGLAYDAPDVIPSGWTTFRLVNKSAMAHFALVERMPEAIGIKEQQEQIAPVFQEGMNLLNEGKPDSAMAVFGGLPEWFHKIEFRGGPGLTAPSHTSTTTVYLEPGTYLIECYVKTNGIFHSYNSAPSTYGMVHQIIVSADSSKAPEPKADVRMLISNEGGIEVEGDLRPGEHTVAVHFVDQEVHENFVGSDVHLVRLTDETDLDALETWMDWSQPKGLETPAPAEFLGGCNEMPAGGTAYFTVQLDPGRYAWISEVPKSREKGLLKVFTVAAGS